MLYSAKAIIQPTKTNQCTFFKGFLNIITRVRVHSTKANTTTFYRRELPPILSSFTSEKGKQLFKTALMSGEANIFYSLSGNFTMQSEPAFCGLGSLTMILNALSIDPQRRWKGVWRWYSDEMLDCCASHEWIKEHGLTFQQLAATARGNGLEVVAKQANHVSYDEFLNDLKAVTRSENMHMIVSFSRESLGQTGDGHFSPVGAFSTKDNEVLIMDTARFKYPSYFVDSKLLFDAMFPIDKATGLPRGYLLLSKGNSKPLPLCRISAQKLEWATLTDLFWNKLPIILDRETDLAVAIKTILTSIPHDYHFFTSIELNGFDLAGSKESNSQLTTDLREEIDKLLKETKDHSLYNIVSKISMDCSGSDPSHIRLENPSHLQSLATLFLLSVPRDLLNRLPSNIVLQILQKRDIKNLPLLKEEVDRMSMQWSSMLSSHCACGVDQCSKN
jgi:glutathione gamma-glutamylcysteinyltransferase